MAVAGKSLRLSWLLGCRTCALLRRHPPFFSNLARFPRRLLGGGSDVRRFSDETSARQWAVGVVARLDSRERQYLREAMRTFDVEDGGTEVTKLTKLQIRQVFLYNAIPFVGFGFLDNGIMIVAGEYIDFTFGTIFSISTMAAAALGNLVSDVCGVGLAGYVELIATRFGIPTPNITAAQYELKEARWSSGLGRAVGVAFGCLIGMFPLLFFADEDDEKEEGKAEETKVEMAQPAPPCDASSAAGAKKTI